MHGGRAYFSPRWFEMLGYADGELRPDPARGDQRPVVHGQLEVRLDLQVPARISAAASLAFGPVIERTINRASTGTNFLLNCPPNRDGLLDPAIVERLREVGAAWVPSAARPPLPAQGPQNEFPYTPVSATATSGNPNNAIDGKNDSDFISMWEPGEVLPQTITLDLGQVRPDVGWLGCLPRYRHENSSKDGNVTAYRIFTSSDGKDFAQAASGNWAADGRMKAATFLPRPARYVRFQIVSANGKPAVTEISVGGRPN